jgi:uncharacterized membrane-anchored protein YitT (DUF2179 family)
MAAKIPYFSVLLFILIHINIFLNNTYYKKLKKLQVWTQPLLKITTISKFMSPSNELTCTKINIKFYKIQWSKNGI